jgi:dimeric dUTPase (all-alpha-NTP-PPase superfamily)
MNVTDVRVSADGVFLTDVFELQSKLMSEYISIEGKNGIGLGLLAASGTNSLDSARRQYVIKDFAWRITEEIMEAVEAWRKWQFSRSDTDLEHSQEEIADSFHFLVELLIIAGISDRDLMMDCQGKDPIVYYMASMSVARDQLDMDSRIVVFLEALGCAMNCLKQKPWKQSQMFTDVKKFRDLLRTSFGRWVYMAQGFKMTSKNIIEIYLKKHRVNEFRQRSNY